VLTGPDSPAFAGAVALAAGHFQGMMRVEQANSTPGRNRVPGGGSQLEVVVSGNVALQLTMRIEAQVAAVVRHYDQLGDDCDFLTLAADWPYRYSVENAEGAGRGIYALDDLIGRRLDANDPGRLDRARKRWAYAGRLLGDPASSVARAMAALFLQPSSALLWNTYDGGVPWSDYELSWAAGRLRQDVVGIDAVEHRAGRRADLQNWHRMFDPVNRFGLVFVNSSGEPERFSITGGPGRAADVPRGGPVAVSMIHSFAAVDLADPQTIARRWLEQGAYIFYGSVNEPFLPAFRRPALVADLLAEEIPLVAALRQGESEQFGSPWRLIYLGDPLYRLEASRTSALLAESKPAVKRMNAEKWQRITPAYANWRVVEFKTPDVPVEEPNNGHRPESARLDWCLKAAVAESVAGLPLDARAATPNRAAPRAGESGAPPPIDWRSSLRSIERARLEQKLRPVLDELLIDALGVLGADEELQSRLEQIPADEKSPRVWLAIETCAAARLARIDLDPDRARGFRRALDLWDEVIHLSWPKGSLFPAQFTERMTAVASADRTHRMRPWLVRLSAALEEMSARPRAIPHAAVVSAERARVEEKLGHHGLRW
jgi:hypothetical protein